MLTVTYEVVMTDSSLLSSVEKHLTSDKSLSVMGYH